MNRLILLILLASLFLVACTGATPPPATPTPATPPSESTPLPDVTPALEEGNGLETVRVGYVPVTIYAPLFIAVEKGYFSEEGIQVELQPVDGGSDNVVQVAAGNFDVAGGGIGAGMLNAVARGIEFEIVAPLHTERPPLASPFVVSKKRFDSGELTSISDLKGKKVATNAKGSATEYWLWKALQQGGLDFKDVEVVGLGFRDVPPALENGSLDGSILGEPLATLAEDQGLIARLSQDYLSDVTPTVIYYNKQWADEHPELAKGFVKAYLRGARDLNGELWYDPENLAIIEKHTNVPVDVIERANRSHHDPNGVVPVADLMVLQEFFGAQGQLNYDEMIDLGRFVNQSYAEQAVQELGGPVEWEK